jgi:hypothetical protein
MKTYEFKDLDLYGEDMFPEYVEQGVDILQAGEVTYLAFADQRDVEEVTEQIDDPQQAAYYTLCARSLRPEDPVTIDFRLLTALGKAISSQVPNWRDLREARPIEEPHSEYHRYYRKAA